MNVTKKDIDKAELAVSELNVDRTADGLYEMFWVQESLSALVWDMSKPDNMQMAYAAFVLSGEIHELIEKVGFKIWKDSPALTEEQLVEIADEFADVMAFLGQLMVMVSNRTSLSPQDFAEAYKNKSHKNLMRFLGKSGESGYSGVANGKD